MEPIKPLDAMPVWVIVSMTSDGSITYHNPTTNYAIGVPTTHFLSLEDAQHEQMLLKLRGTKSHVFQLNIPVT